MTRAGAALDSPAKPGAEQLLFHPQDIGAKVDGTTLDSLAINAAIASARVTLANNILRANSL